ncbi:MAG: hypothetical protein GEU94_18915 [Micromonosporaceae bacterium]|nr:hypothetical protein [Micromonosporaceae bacterium]
MHPLILDTSALLGVGRVIWLSRLLAATHRRPDVPLLVPAACLLVAGQERPHLTSHVGSLPAICVIELAYHHLLTFEQWRWPEPDAAHTASIALPSAEHPDGAPVVTDEPERYEPWPHVRTLPLHD